MNAQLGIWLDHKSARVIEIDGDEVRSREIESGVERRTRATGGTQMSGRSFLKSGSGQSGHRDEVRRQALERFYETLSLAIDGHANVLLVGPGTAKSEFAHFLKQKNPNCHVTVEPEQRLTSRQLVARVKRYFMPSPHIS